MTHGNDKGRSATLHAPISPTLKNAAVTACEQGQSLADFVELALVEYIKNHRPEIYKDRSLDVRMSFERKEPLPRWTKGLSKRVAECLLKEGYTGKIGVRKDFEAGKDFSRVMNMTPKLAQEVADWLL